MPVCFASVTFESPLSFLLEFDLPEYTNQIVPILGRFASTATVKVGVFGETVGSPTLTNISWTGEMLEHCFQMMA